LKLGDGVRTNIHRLTASRRLSKIRDYYPDWGNMVNQRGDYQDFLLSFYWEHL